VEERQVQHTFKMFLVRCIRETSFLLQISAKDKSVHVEDSSLVLCFGSGLEVTVLQMS